MDIVCIFCLLVCLLASPYLCFSHIGGRLTEVLPSFLLSVQNREGYLIKRGGILTGWKKRYFIACVDAIYYYETRELAYSYATPKGTSMITGVLSSFDSELRVSLRLYLTAVGSFLFFLLMCRNDFSGRCTRRSSC